MIRRIKISAVFLLGAIFLSSCAVTGPVNEKKKIVLQISDSSQEKQALVLNVADNLTEVYGDKLEMEIVAFGPGLRLLLTDSINNKRVQGLADKGVRFSACRNTYKKMSKLSGKKLALSAVATETGGGAARIVELIGQGYILIRP
jgi:intracellular sulfur oxidation DsrE/DsrF family protein